MKKYPSKRYVLYPHRVLLVTDLMAKMGIFKLLVFLNIIYLCKY